MLAFCNLPCCFLHKDNGEPAGIFWGKSLHLPLCATPHSFPSLDSPSLAPLCTPQSHAHPQSLPTWKQSFQVILCLHYAAPATYIPLHVIPHPAAAICQPAGCLEASWDGNFLLASPLASVVGSQRKLWGSPHLTTTSIQLTMAVGNAGIPITKQFGCASQPLLSNRNSRLNCCFNSRIICIELQTIVEWLQSRL